MAATIKHIVFSINDSDNQCYSRINASIVAEINWQILIFAEGRVVGVGIRHDFLSHMLLHDSVGIHLT